MNMAHLVVKVIERCENATESAKLGKGFAEYVRPNHEYTYEYVCMFLLKGIFITTKASSIVSFWQLMASPISMVINDSFWTIEVLLP